jgi:hypothetical protein
MFPLDFPLGILQRHAQAGQAVLDPFCGRGTTNFAARLVGLSTLGIDSSPVAVAISAAKLVTASPKDICEEARRSLGGGQAAHVPVGEFWRWAYHAEVLEDLCRLREVLLADCMSPARIALRAILLGALHGPAQKGIPSYFSNQSPRTYAPKPVYATRFWQDRGLAPSRVDTLALIERRAIRYFSDLPHSDGLIRQADSRKVEAVKAIRPERSFDWVITSPPYYGMRTYIPDQWLRNWFVGGPDRVDYSSKAQLVHSSPENFAADLHQVWCNAFEVCTDSARMVIRFGGITDRRVDPLTLIKNSLEDTGWRITTARRAGTAIEGKRQADTFLRKRTKPVAEYDVWATKRKQREMETCA